MRKFCLIFIAALPGIAFAANEGQGIKGIISGGGRLVSSAILVAGGLGLLAFFIGLVKFIFKADDVKSHAEGRNQMVWGLIAIFVMFSVWGLVRFIGTAFNIQPDGTYTPGAGYSPGAFVPAPRGGTDPVYVDQSGPPCGFDLQHPCS
ncbi:MAG: hypothetical protein JWL80_308 [Parcubacteria group bacterium]|nr:hypothetical protein [Parcubacteria group bacterium]